MIWSPFSSLILVDLTIVGLATLLVAVGFFRGAYKKGRTSRTGRYLITAGILTTAAYYLADLVAISIMPALSGPLTSMVALEFLQHHVRVPAMLVSFGLMVSGAILAARNVAAAEESLRRSDELAARSVATIIDSENRFRSLVEQYSDAVYCFEFTPPIDASLPADEQMSRVSEGVLVECNEAYANAVGADSPAEIMGKQYNSLHPDFRAVGNEQAYYDFVQGGYRLNDREIRSVRPSGHQYAVLLNVTGVVKDGSLLRIWGSEKDILAQLETESKLQDRARFQQTVAIISARLITTPDDQLDAALEDCLRLACSFAGADRVTLLWFDREHNRAERLYYWSSDSEPPPSTVVSLDRFPWILEQIYRGESVVIESVAGMPLVLKDRQVLADLGLKSVAGVPLVGGGDVVGVCNFSVIEAERNWSEQALQDMQVLSNLLVNVVNRINVQKSLDAALGKLCLAQERLEAENIYLRQEIRSTHGFHELIGESDGLIRCLQQVAQVAATDTTVLVLGETGTGKELVARAVHDRSDRSDRALVKINCAALPADLIESELFGHEKGAFTGADSRKRGRFDLADGGTLFLDEIGDLPLDLQGKLLRVLQDGQFERLGGNETIKVDVRIIAATNRKLQEAVDLGDFRADLFYRINTFPIVLPPLRERKNDIPLLTEHFVSKHSASLGKDVTGVSIAMMDQLQAFAWPGNVRELESVVQRALISAAGPVLHLAEPLDDSLPFSAPRIVGTVDNPLDLRTAEKAYIATILEQTDWKIAGTRGAAAKLGLPPSTLRSKMKKLGIHRRTATGTTQKI